ncbi:BICD family-like cargo adapter 2 isoform X3 [Neltuma alba]|uniref:BICD family-like cargo adapter 2 isoform X3 n=1 Tax=Neltuma alba TaxID=207710 RepID=UPI0010A4C9D4|nr:BICD family-like cargo adapter 2 isoform X3 [Prosopis alba]
MEEEKRRKKNKKKKNKQSKAVVDGVVAAEQSASGDQNLVNNGKDEHSQLSEDTDEQSTIAYSNRQPPNGKECINLTVQGDSGNQQETEREARINLAISEEIVRKLRNDDDMLVQKEVISEETIKKLKEENNVLIQKEAMSVGTIRNVKEENAMHIQKEATLEEAINRLRTENDLLAKEQDTLEMRMAQLQSENDSLLQIKAGLEEKTNQLLNENSVLGLKVESLVERINHLERDISISFEREKSTKETVSYLNDDISRLQSQVAELEVCRNTLLLENQELKENLSGLQTKIWNLEKTISSFSLNASAKDYASENEDFKSQIEAAQVLVEKLVAENAELVEKVNELYVERDLPSAAVELSGASGTDGLDESAKPDTAAVALPESEEHISMSIGELNSSGEAPVEDKSSTVNAAHTGGVISSFPSASEDSGEIVQIPLDDNDVRSPESLAARDVEQDDEVPLTDAPLVGAPFRLISFVAKYVSGADLVNQSSSNTGGQRKG